ncbi:AraC-like DNA-binding protein [Hamadaea flava]|uniref:DUF6597 domain-containing transcriptional factor n=1 Tax=Hamadaea flava TaxID=1742688 RepID=A0ABV8LJR0_9ACTN|nr:AraC family transcriptional regulator [Hamadaea flava]MCP2324314.1 AraC-like DNA-binding protein [Hamadaea flava]
MYAETPARLGVLTPWVACTWVRRVPAAAGVSALVVPDGCVDLLWMDGRLQVVGPDTRPRDVPLTPGTSIAGIRLRPGAARLLTGSTPVSALTDEQVDLTDLWGGTAYKLMELMEREPEAARVLEETLARRVARHAPEPLVMAAARALDQAEPPPVPSLAADLGVSERNLRRKVVAAVGYGPKTLEQVLRFGRASRAAADGVELARVAHDAGYADQAHLSREVRRWSGQPVPRPQGV